MKSEQREEWEKAMSSEIETMHMAFRKTTRRTKISPYGTRCLTLDPGLKRKLNWSSLTADVSQPILGVDCLESLKRKSGYSLDTHCILTKCPPVASKARRFSPEKLEAVKKEFSSPIAQDISKRKKSVISVDRLKPALMEIEDPVPAQIKPVQLHPRTSLSFLQISKAIRENHLEPLGSETAGMTIQNNGKPERSRRQRRQRIDVANYLLVGTIRRGKTGSGTICG
ncbi:hypothetical protein TNCT_112501 [Trichonephila clavata]|uniref:Uncharacterized protein n=1 Tax=Trichonephila clavata TaxID=2740835 RepID=A0A8X6GQY0_TRICU|nr:hypothetical protein TNCT_112501 [Trichonephila clavata]